MDLRHHAAHLAIAGFSTLMSARAESTGLEVPAFMESVVAPLRVQHCAKVMTDYAARFAPAFHQWTLNNEQKIMAGRRLMAADAERTGRPLASFTRSLEQTTLLGMSAMSESELRAFCEASLMVLSYRP